jgi:thiamine biosynthesis lipoprotein
LIDLGGNVVTVGSKPDGRPWRIGLQDPEPGVPRGQHVGILDLTGSVAVVTSGVYERVLVSGGVSYHHILDTRTGLPVRNGLTAVTIVSPDSFDAAGWSTTLFALGRERGMALAQVNGIEALFFTEARDVYATAGVSARLRLTDARFTLRALNE